MKKRKKKKHFKGIDSRGIEKKTEKAEEEGQKSVVVGWKGEEKAEGRRKEKEGEGRRRQAKNLGEPTGQKRGISETVAPPQTQEGNGEGDEGVCDGKSKEA